MKIHPIALLRGVALAEAVSFLGLLGIAMPLKYWANLPEAVRVVGMVHGLLFVIFCGALLRAMIVAKLSVVRAAVVFGASFVPLVPFWLDARLRVWEAEGIGGTGG